LAEVGFEDTLIRKCKALSNGAVQAWGHVGENIGGEGGFDVGERVTDPTKRRLRKRGESSAGCTSCWLVVAGAVLE
jgi:hypothetical protein